MLVNALQGYLDLQDDEVLLAIVGINKPGSPLVGCALTTKRVYWSGAGEKATGFRPSRRRSLDFSSIAETIGVAGVFSSLVDLGKKQRISLIINQPIRDALVAFLRASRSLARRDAEARYQGVRTAPSREGRGRAWSTPTFRRGHSKPRFEHSIAMPKSFHESL